MARRKTNGPVRRVFDMVVFVAVLATCMTSAQRPGGGDAGGDFGGDARGGAGAADPAPDSVVAPVAGQVADRGPADFHIDVCPAIEVANKPSTNAQGRVRGAKPYVRVQGIKLLIKPVDGRACLSSGFGQRDGSLHQGVDYGLFAGDGAPNVVAAGRGTVVEAGYRDDYGNYVVIDHGGGVFTLYAHLANVAGGGVGAGARVNAGKVLGRMGGTASYAMPVHLHYEIRLGALSAGGSVFSLDPKDPLSFPFVS